MKISTLCLSLLCGISTTTNSFAFVVKPSSLKIGRNGSSGLHLTTGPSGKAAASSEEDLQLTRQIILDHQQLSNAEEEEGEEVGRKYASPELPERDLMIRAALGKTVERTPVWLFRQAGRHLPEYRDYKVKTGRSFLDMLSYPEDVAECTLQPLRRYDVDAAILFSDILVLAEALGIEVTMPGGVGILVPNPLSAPEEVYSRLPPLEQINEAFVQDKLSVVLESVKLIRLKMKEEGMKQPLIGFSAAPWTLLFYMCGGSSKKNNEIGMKWLAEHTSESQHLLQILTTLVTEYMSAQVEAGAHMLQLFEAMGMMIDEENFNKYAKPCLKQIASTLKERFPDIPLMVFSRGASFANEELSKLGYDVVTIDGTVDRSTARDTMGDRCGMQGNYDPANLISDGTDNTPETVRATTKEMLDILGPQRLIANLGEGLGGKEDPELVDAFVTAIHEESERLIAAQQKQSA